MSEQQSKYTAPPGGWTEADLCEAIQELRAAVSELNPGIAWRNPCPPVPAPREAPETEVKAGIESQTFDILTDLEVDLLHGHRIRIHGTNGRIWFWLRQLVGDGIRQAAEARARAKRQEQGGGG